jgi:aminoglycoside phosphotransferase (APT) family kinase protein
VSKASAQERVLDFLRESGLLARDQSATMTPLSGGVSSDLWKVSPDEGEPLCVKSALAKLKVDSDWFAPVSRNHIEYEWLRFAGRLRPGHAPRVLAHDEEAGFLAMEYLRPDRYPVWKTLLLAGSVDTAAAAAVGDLIGCLHEASAADPGCVATFATDTNFEALRIAPYLRATGAAHPDLGTQLTNLARTTAGKHLAVVHGDLSPKNILLGPDGPVLLDAECAWFGEPAFDVAFCLNHLLLKSIKLPDHAAGLADAAHAMRDEYLPHVKWESAESLETRVAALLPALALARIDGSSPVEYLDDTQRSLVRSASRKLLHRTPTDIEDVWQRWTDLTHERAVAI